MLCFKHHLAQRTLLKWSPLMYFFHLSIIPLSAWLETSLFYLPTVFPDKKFPLSELLNPFVTSSSSSLPKPPQLRSLIRQLQKSFNLLLTSIQVLLCLLAKPDAVHTPKHTAPLSAINYPGMLFPIGRSSDFLLPCMQSHSFLFALYLNTWIGQMLAFCFQSAKQVSASTSCFSSNLANSSYFNFLLPVISRRSSLCMTSGHWLVILLTFVWLLLSWSVCKTVPLLFAAIFYKDFYTAWKVVTVNRFLIHQGDYKECSACC